MRLLTLVLLAAPVLANGTLSVRGDASDMVRLTAHDVTAVLRDRVAEVTVEQEFASRSNRRLEGIYVFPLPDGATVSDFAMTMGGRMVRGAVMERKKAKRIYEGIVAKQNDPGLLEKIDRGVFRARVFPIEPNGTVRIRLQYQQILPDNAGTIELRYPLARERLQAAPVDRISVSVDVESTVDLKAVYCPSHEAEIERPDARRARVRWRAERAAQEKDFLLYVGRDEGDVGFTLLSHQAAAEDGTFLAILAPPVEVAATKALPKDVVYVLDTSGSMEGPKLAQAQQALKSGIRRLRPGDRFNVIAFATDVRPFRDGLVAANDATKAAAAAGVDALRANGGTAIDEALHAALGMGDPRRLGIVAFLTDGLPTVGESNPGNIEARVLAANRTKARIFVFGVGFDQNVKFLDRIADGSGGAREYITPKQDLEVVVSRFFERIDQPVLTDLALEIPGVREVYPRRLPDLFAGDQVLVFGRYADAGPRRIRLEGKLQGRTVTYEYEGVLDGAEKAPPLPRLWAQRKIAFLLEQMRMNGRRDELVKEVVRLGTKYSIVTPYTAGLVVEDEPAVPEEQLVEEPPPPVTEEVMDRNEIDTDSEFEEAEPFTGPSTGSAIGVGAGGMRRTTRRNLRAYSRSGTVANSVDPGLEWLARAQREDGGWGGAADTAHVLLGFLGAGYTDRGSKHENRYAARVRNGIRNLMSRQDAKGAFAADLQEHALATLALAEAYWMTRNPRYKRPAQDGLNHLAAARNPYLGWGAKPRDGTNDTLTTVWAVCALKSGKHAGLEVDPDAFEGARQWFLRVEKPTDAERAGVLLARIFLGEDPHRSDALKRLAAACVAAPPGPGADLEYLYLGTLALFQYGGDAWRAWNAALTRHIHPLQREDGSWPARSGAGELRTTSSMVMCQEVYYRYERIFAAPRPR